MKTILFAVAIFFYTATNLVFSQSVAINTDGSTANASAMLDVKSTLKGMLIPRMSRTERNAIASPATGLIIFQNAPDSIGLYYYNGSGWTWILANSNSDTLAWRTGGNTGTVDGNHFIGTKDNIPFNIKVNNQKAGRIDHIGWNTFYGYQAGNANGSAIHNTAVGYQAFLSNTSGNNNTAIGTLAANANTSGGENTAMGYGASYINTVGSGNTTYGFYSMYNNVAGSFGTAVGYQAMLYANNTTTPFINGNSAFGYEAMKGSTTPSANTGNFNNALGYRSLWNNSTGGSNTALGATAMFSNTSGGGNTAIGNGALYLNAGGDQNTAIGVNALQASTSGLQNTALGVNSLYTNATGNYNTAIGSNAGYSLTAGSNNVFLGYQAGYNETGSNKLYIANSSSNPPLLYGDFSTGRIGIGTITPGEKLEVNGNIQLTTGGIVQAAPSTSGSSYSITLRGGDPYVPVGGSGGSVNITATNNMPSGGSGYGNLGTSGAINLTAGSGYNSGGGHINITAGQTSCWALASNSHADVNIQGGQNLVAADAASINVQGGGTVGVGCPTANANGGNLILKSGIGTGTGTQGTIQLLNGNVGIGTSAPSSKLEVCGNTRIIGTLNVSSTVTSSSGITCPSDIRYKKNIVPLDNPIEKLMQVNAVQYNWRKEEFPNMNFNDKPQTGFIAQELEKVFPEMVFTDEAGYKSVDYSRLTPLLVETIKEQQKEIKAISARLTEVEKLLKKH